MSKLVLRLAAAAVVLSACAVGSAGESAKGADAEAKPEDTIAADDDEVVQGPMTPIEELKGIELKDQIDKISYSIGHNIGSSYKRQSIRINEEALLQGLKDGLSDIEPLLTKEERMEAMAALQEEMKKGRLQKVAPKSVDNKGMAEKNKREGEAFLAANAKKEGVKVLPSGLQYEVITAGDGTSPKVTDEVTVHYRGTLINGSEFDSSYKRGKPANFRVNGVVKGFSEALQLMKVGAKWRVFIPAELAYGERGPGGPNSVLIFDMELLGINEGK